jgi:uncharacterized protein (TIGR04222 family)
MNWLFENPLSELPGPLFLALYTGVISLVIWEALRQKGRADRSLELGPEPIPTKPDPVEIAYLRGGENEVTRLLVFDLIRRGYLRIETTEPLSKQPKSEIVQSSDHSDLTELSPIEKDVFDFFVTPQKPEALFKPGGLASRMKTGLSPMIETLREDGLIFGPERIGAAWTRWFTGALMILAFGGFKFAIAIAKGKHNVAFLVIFAIVGLIVLAFTCAVPRLTRRGTDYIDRLREAFEGLKPRLVGEGAPSMDPAFVLVPAIFGISSLAGTPFAYAPNLFPSASKQSSGGCGSGCGSSCGGGGGCGGGGCGGCGS